MEFDFPLFVFREQQKPHAPSMKSRRLMSGCFSKILASKPLVALSFLVSLCDWSCGVAVLWVALLGLNVYVPFWVVIVTMAIGEMAQTIPIGVPGMLGIYEAAITAALSIFSIPIAIAASAALLSRVVISLLE